VKWGTKEYGFEGKCISNGSTPVMFLGKMDDSSFYYCVSCKLVNGDISIFIDDEVYTYKINRKSDAVQQPSIIGSWNVAYFLDSGVVSNSPEDKSSYAGFYIDGTADVSIDGSDLDFETYFSADGNYIYAYEDDEFLPESKYEYKIEGDYLHLALYDSVPLDECEDIAVLKLAP
jgi:hypothetical protein